MSVHPSTLRRPRAALSAGAALLAIGLLAGCAERHHVIVGAIPDDYRTNHPIVISELEEHIDLPVGRSEYGMTQAQRVALEGFLARYDQSAAPVVSIITPSGAANSYAAAQATSGLIDVAIRNGVPAERITTLAYVAESPEASPPIRVSYVGVRAHVGQCGRWPADLLDTVENRHYANYGCASQNNLAAQVANPTDLVGPRKPAPIDPENRANAIGQYKARQIAPDFLSNSEIGY